MQDLFPYLEKSLITALFSVGWVDMLLNHTWNKYCLMVFSMLIRLAFGLILLILSDQVLEILTVRII